MASYKFRRSKHSIAKKVAMVLYYVGSEGGYRETAGALGVSKSWCVCVVRAFTKILASRAHEWINVPTSRSEWQRVARGFESKQGFFGVVGAVDGTLIDIERPSDYDGFYNRHGDPSLNVQAVVDANTRFMSVDVRPGSYSDKKIWKLSTFGRSIKSRIPLGTHIIGDSGYTLFPWLLTPFLPHEEGGDLTPVQLTFNFKMSSTRMPVECAFGRLKERFRILKTVMNEQTLKQTVRLVMSCFVLHNMLLHAQDDMYDIPDDARDQNNHTQPFTDSADVETNDVVRRAAKRANATPSPT
ncbi:hypothetical protein ACHHYP_16994 [Achlya hypogyna]|uniref:DDE Tnp4 domain-containing protein n=1 Tax=Achlya hypogyna TaxID=1202772 RepID=A0A1V9Y5F1_ACHHY|nr:hypothetical protein ACHHYP_16994 [Achlya hypogyna]